MRGWLWGLWLGLLLLPVSHVARADPASSAPVPLVSPQRLVERIQAGENIVFVDVREPFEYEPVHVPGALNIPQRLLADRKAELPRDALLIPYCNMDFRGFVAARELQSMGFQVALMQERGLEGWKAQGLPVAGAKTGISDADALAKVRSASPKELLGERFVPRVVPTGRVETLPVDMAEWHFSPNQLQVTAGDEVHIAVRSKQGEHYFILPDYEVQVKVPEGETREVVFVADRAGTYRFGTCEFDGATVQVMKGQLEVKPRPSTLEEQ